MQPEPHHGEPSLDPILDGRDSLRLVKLRLGLTLIAVAVLPIAAVSPLVRAVAEEARVAHHQRLVDQAQITVGELRREIELVQDATEALIDDPAIVAAAAPKAEAAERKRASDRLASLTRRPRGAVVAATLVTDGEVHAAVGSSIDLDALPAGVLDGGLASHDRRLGCPGHPGRAERQGREAGADAARRGVDPRAACRLPPRPSRCRGASCTSPTPPGS